MLSGLLRIAPAASVQNAHTAVDATGRVGDMEMIGSDTAHPDSNKICYFLTLKKLQTTRRLLVFISITQEKRLFWCIIKDRVTLLFPKAIQAQTRDMARNSLSYHMFLAKYCLNWDLENRTDPHLRQKSHTSDVTHCLNSIKVSSMLKMGTLHTQNPIIWKGQGFLSDVK